MTVAGGLLLVTLDNSVLYTALPTLSEALGASSSQALWIINAYPLVMAGLLLGAGTLGDRIGHRRMFLVGQVVFGVASLAAAFSRTPEQLIAARAFLAVGAAAMMPATLALIGLSFHDTRERNIAIALWGSVALIGAALGPIIGGLLLQQFWWGSVFLINVPVVLLTLVATWVLAPHGQRDTTRPWDLVSSVLALAALSGLVFAIKSLIATPAAVSSGGAALVVATLGVVAFVHRQRRLPYPLLDFGIFRNPVFVAGTLSAVVTLFALAGLQLLTTQRFQLVEGFTPLHAGLLVSVAALGALPSALLGGSILHRVGFRPLISGGLACAAVGVALVAVGFAHDIGWVVAGMVLTGVGTGAAISVASTAIIGSVPPHRVGMASSVEEVAYEFGGLLAVAVLGSLGAALYRLQMSSLSEIPDAARQSMVEALHAAQVAGAGTWLDTARDAFDAGYQTGLWVIAGLLLAGAAGTAWMLRDAAGQSTQAANPVH